MQFMESAIPESVLEAGRIDGATEYRMFYSVVMPAVKPAWLTLMVLSFNQLWNISGGIFIQSEVSSTPSAVKPVNSLSN